MRTIEKKVANVNKTENEDIQVSKTKFLKVTAKSKQLNQKLIDKAKALAGVKGHLTNLDITVEKIIADYQQLFQVEATFRMAKTDLWARPIYHRKRDSIEAHLTIIFAALAINREIELVTGISIKKFVKILRPIRSGIVTINGNEIFAELEVPQTAVPIL